MGFSKAKKMNSLILLVYSPEGYIRKGEFWLLFIILRGYMLYFMTDKMQNRILMCNFIMVNIVSKVKHLDHL
jgi:hypothetical protein